MTEQQLLPVFKFVNFLNPRYGLPVPQVTGTLNPGLRGTVLIRAKSDPSNLCQIVMSKVQKLKKHRSAKKS